VAISLTTFIQAAQLRAAQAGTTAKAVIEAILVGQFQSSVSNGRTIIQTAEAGGSVQFAIPDGLPLRKSLNWPGGRCAGSKVVPIPITRVSPVKFVGSG
jgi:hypothetical protein